MSNFASSDRGKYGIVVYCKWPLEINKPLPHASHRLEGKINFLEKCPPKSSLMLHPRPHFVNRFRASPGRGRVRPLGPLFPPLCLALLRSHLPFARLPCAGLSQRGVNCSQLGRLAAVRRVFVEADEDVTLSQLHVLPTVREPPGEGLGTVAECGLVPEAILLQTLEPRRVCVFEKPRV